MFLGIWRVISGSGMVVEIVGLMQDKVQVNNRLTQDFVRILRRSLKALGSIYRVFYTNFD